MSFYEQFYKLSTDGILSPCLRKYLVVGCNYKSFEMNINIVFNKHTNLYEFYSEENKLVYSLSEEDVKRLVDLYYDTSRKIRVQMIEGSKERLDKLEERKIGVWQRLKENLDKMKRLKEDLDKLEKIDLFTQYQDIKTNLTFDDFQYHEPVVIYLPDDDISLKEAEALTNMCGYFMESLGYELETENEPIIGSFLQNLWFIIKKGSAAAKNEITENFEKGKKALELKYVELPTAEQTEKLANSAAKIVELLEKQKEGVVRLGSLVVLKKQINGESKLIIQQLNFELITILDNNPQIIFNLQTTYDLLTGDLKSIKYLDQIGTKTLNS